MRNTDVKKWYRYPFVWMLIAIPLSSVLVGITMLTISIQTFDGLVADDYYKRGLQINQRLSRDTRARELGLQANLSMSESATRVEFSNAATLASETLSLRFSHSTRGGLDKVLTLERIGTNIYRAAPVTLESGRWYVEIGNSAWRLTAAVFGSSRTLSLGVSP